MERKYQRVEMGVGAFHHPPRVKYSEETKSLIKLLMEESKLSMMQRKSIQDVVDKGGSLPPPSLRLKSKSKKLDSGSRQVVSPSMWKRRTQDMIISSGAYEREQCRRSAPLPSVEKQKRHLACMMAYGKDMPETPRGPRILHGIRREPRYPESTDPINDLVQGIRERLEFLKDMESLGMQKKYRPIIQQEIAEKIRLMDSIDEEKSKEFQKEIQGYRYERPPPKPFPLGDLDDN
ncbi:hypothetical protein KM043_012098 [Ampulex compressa]|nr:hypothetical protein KM043_012098 [Ampulex compressa]